MIKTIPQNILKKLSSHAKNSLEIAEKFSNKIESPYIGTIHLAYGIAIEKGSIGHTVLKNLGISSEDIGKQAVKISREPEKNQGFSKNFWKALGIGISMASAFHYRYIGTEHLLAGIISAENSDFQKLLENKKIKSEEAKKHIKVIFEGSSYLPDILKLFAPFQEGERPNKPRQRPSALDIFGQDLTKQASEKKLDLIAGREKEVEKAINILGRKNKNNPLLIGDPGVGKTAIVHRLAQKIADNDIPAAFIGKRIISLDLPLLIAGTIFRGEFEARLKDVLDEVISNKNIILFIDEIHTIVGAGSASGTMDAANILKPALTKGEFQCIGATTIEEYKKHIEKDPALERRFLAVNISEPSIEEAEEMISTVKHIYEQYHNVAISEDAIKAAVRMSARYILDRKLPDKAIDLLDEAAARAKNSAFPKQNFLLEIAKIEKIKSEAEINKTEAVKKGDLEQAILDRNKIIELEKQIQEIKNKNAKNSEKKAISVTEKHIAKLVAENTGIPAEEISEKESLSLAEIERQITKKIVGQNEAVSIIAKAIRRSRAGISNPNRPIGSFMFLGPTGVGKTELAKTIAEEIFRNPKSLIRIDMSEFTEKHTISRLIGSPAGYAGFGEGGELTEKIRRNPYSVVLFDEIEKAHPDVLNLLLQIMEDGKLSDSAGKTANFNTALIIITSNIGTADFTEEAKIGFLLDSEISKEEEAALEAKYGKIKESALKELKKEIIPELLNRLSGIIVFRPLGLKEIQKIVKIEAANLLERLKKHRNILIEISKKAEQQLAKIAFSPDEGARVVRGAIQRNIEDPISEMILSSEIKNGDKIKIDVRKGKIDISKK